MTTRDGLLNDRAIVLKGDARRLPLPDESVDLIVTSPPYFALRSYRDGGEHYDGQIGSEATPQEFIDNLIECTAEMVRVLKPSGSIFVDLGDKYAGSGGNNQSGLSPAAQRAAENATTYRDGPRGYNQNSGGIRAKSLMLLPERYRIACVDQLGLIARQVIVWSKPNGLPESVKDRCRRSHEDWVHLVRLPYYFSAIDEIRESHSEVSIKRAQPHRADPGRAMREGKTVDGTGMTAHSLRLDQMNNPLGRLPGSVWTIPTEPLSVPEVLEVDHYAAFPQEWPRRLILGWAPEGGTVLDPFGGTGTVAMVARALGRVGISVDLSFDYCRLAQWRIFESGHASKSIGRTARERQESLEIA